MLKVKSFWEPKHKDDGLRILATRFRPRGSKNTRYDVWMANLGPSGALLKSNVNWREFSKLYRQEMLGDDVTEIKNPLIRNAGQKFTLRLIRKLAKTQNVTLMCQCAEDQTQCHRFLLQDLINSKKISSAK